MKFFDKIDRVVNLLEKLEQDLPATSDTGDDPTYQELRSYRKIDHFNVVTSDIVRQAVQCLGTSRSPLSLPSHCPHRRRIS